MSEYTEFKALAEAFPDYDYDSNETPFFNGPSGESLGGESTGLYCVYGPDFEIEGDQYDGVTLIEATTLDQAKFICEAKAVVLALIAENERLRREEKNDAIAYKAVIERQKELRIERDQLKAELDKQFTGELSRAVRVKAEIDQLKAECEALRKGAERYQWLRRNDQVGAWEYLGTIGEDYRDEVIDAAIKKEAEFYAGEGHAKQS